MPRPFQFGLRGIFLATLFIGLLMALATLPEPASSLAVYSLCSITAAGAASRSVWRATLAGGFGGMAGVYLVALVHVLRGQVNMWNEIPRHVFTIGCCFPLGALIGFGIGYLNQERRFQQRLKAKAEELKQETIQFQRQHPPVDDGVDSD